jgi:hypothetical protein
VVRPARLERATSWFVVVARRIHRRRPMKMMVNEISDLGGLAYPRSTSVEAHRSAQFWTVASQSASQHIRNSIHVRSVRGVFGFY